MTAADLVAALESLPLGKPWTDAHDAAERAIAEERAVAAAKIFPTEIKPVTSEALSAYVFHTQRLAPASFGSQLAEIHRRSLATHPDLAALLRAVDALDDVGVHAASLATPASPAESYAAARVRAAAAARAAYEVAIARQLEAGHELAPAARMLIACEGLTARLAAAKARHEEHGRAEQVRIEAQRAAAAAAAEQHMLELAIAEELAKPEHRDAGVDERRRITAVAGLRFRLRRTKASGVRVARALYDPRDLANCVGDYSVERCQAVLEALDRAEEQAS